MDGIPNLLSLAKMIIELICGIHYLTIQLGDISIPILMLSNPKFLYESVDLLAL